MGREDVVVARVLFYGIAWLPLEVGVGCSVPDVAAWAYHPGAGEGVLPAAVR